MKLGCIADDFTGATDLAGLLRRSGASVKLHFGLPDQPSDGSADIEIVALKCRTEPVEKAVADCSEAAHWLLAGGAESLYWKYCSTFDSTGEGNIGPVAEALMAITGQTQALYCPAFPENGRSVFMGNLFVGEQLLNESSLKDHPLTPMTDSNLVRVLEPQVKGSVGLWNRIQQAADQPMPKTTHIIADAVEFNDLVRLIERTPETVLLTGGSALAMPIPDKLGLSSTDPVADPQPAKAAIIFSGSCSQMTNSQVTEWKASNPSYQLKPSELNAETIEQCLNWIDSLDANQVGLVYATDTPEAVKASQAQLGVAAAGELVEQAMATLAQQAYIRGVRRFVVAGGETSGAVTQALGVREVLIGKEICPGVPWVYSGSSKDPVALALKSGNFGSPTFFKDALSLLEQ